jgi:hypothetical protein
MVAKLVVRLLDPSHRLLGWRELPGELRGDACVWVSGAHGLVVDTPGTPAVLSIHWADLNVQSRVPYADPLFLPAGSVVTLHWPDRPVMRFATDDGPLPPVTVRRSVTALLDTASMGATG